MAKQCENEIFGQLPDLKEMIAMIQRYNTPEVIIDQGLFTVFRQMSLEEQVNRVKLDPEQSA